MPRLHFIFGPAPLVFEHAQFTNRGHSVGHGERAPSSEGVMNLNLTKATVSSWKVAGNKNCRTSFFKALFAMCLNVGFYRFFLGIPDTLTLTVAIRPTPIARVMDLAGVNISGCHGSGRHSLDQRCLLDEC